MMVKLSWSDAASALPFPSAIGRWEVGFGKHKESSQRITIEMQSAVFVEKLTPEYDQYVSETKGFYDGDEADPVEKAGHPTFADAIQRPLLLQYIIKECILDAFLDLFTDNEQAKWMLAEIETVSLHDERISVQAWIDERPLTPR